MAHAQAASEDQPTPHPKSVSSSTAIYRALTQASNQEDTDQKDELAIDKAEKTIQKIDSITHQPLSISPRQQPGFFGGLFQDDSAENDGQTQESSLSSSDQILGKIAEQENESGHRSKWEVFWNDPLTQDVVTIASMVPVGRVGTTALRVGEEVAPSITGKLFYFFKPGETGAKSIEIEGSTNPIGRDYPSPVDHYNIEVHSPDPLRPGKFTRDENTHIIVNSDLNPMEVILKNKNSTNNALTNSLR